jgi:CDP-diglyceride synthetase
MEAVHACLLATVLTTATLTPRTDVGERAVAAIWSIGALTYVCWLGGFLMRILFLPGGRALLLFVVLFTTVRNIGAAISGRLFHGHPLTSFSAKKTYEGLFCGAAAGTACVVLARPLLPGTWGAGELVLLTVALTFAGHLGDLVETMFKRAAGRGPSGPLLGGQGGFLDVLDSYLFVAPFFYLFCTWSIPQ